MRLDPVTYELQGVWYNSHRSIEGEWRPAHRTPRTPNGRPVAYVARCGHGTYPKARLAMQDMDKTGCS